MSQLKWVLALAFLGTGMLLVGQAWAEENELLTHEDGRFKIFIAEHNAILKGKNITMKSIFKMDKETGTVWRYRQGVDSKGKPYEEFFEVPNQ